MVIIYCLLDLINRLGKGLQPTRGWHVNGAASGGAPVPLYVSELSRWTAAVAALSACQASLFDRGVAGRNGRSGYDGRWSVWGGWKTKQEDTTCVISCCF